MTIECKTCKFWLQSENDVNKGMCRERPPHIMVEKINNKGEVESWHSVFPSMFAHGWCGRHKRKTTKKINENI